MSYGIKVNGLDLSIGYTYQISTYGWLSLSYSPSITKAGITYTNTLDSNGFQSASIYKATLPKIDNSMLFIKCSHPVSSFLLDDGKVVLVSNQPLSLQYMRFVASYSVPKPTEGFGALVMDSLGNVITDITKNNLVVRGISSIPSPIRNNTYTSTNVLPAIQYQPYALVPTSNFFYDDSQGFSRSKYLVAIGIYTSGTPGAVAARLIILADKYSPGSSSTWSLNNNIQVATTDGS